MGTRKESSNGKRKTHYKKSKMDAVHDVTVTRTPDEIG